MVLWSREGSDSLASKFRRLVQTTWWHFTEFTLFTCFVLGNGAILLRLHDLSELSFTGTSLGAKRVQEVRVLAVPVTTPLYHLLVLLLLVEVRLQLLPVKSAPGILQLI